MIRMDQSGRDVIALQWDAKNCSYPSVPEVVELVNFTNISVVSVNAPETKMTVSGGNYGLLLLQSSKINYRYY